MPLKSGYSKATVDANIAEMVRAKYPHNQASAIALEKARESYFSRYPEGFLPAHLKLPNGRRDRKAWEESTMRAHNPCGCSGARRSNPVPPSSRARSRGGYDSRQHRINAASKLYEDFTGHDAEQALTIDMPPLPDVMLCVGDIDFIGYTTVRDGQVEKYIHKFSKNCRPLFAVSHDGKSLHMIGGSYDFTERGIVDRTK